MKVGVTEVKQSGRGWNRLERGWGWGGRKTRGGVSVACVPISCSLLSLLPLPSYALGLCLLNSKSLRSPSVAVQAFPRVSKQLFTYPKENFHISPSYSVCTVASVEGDLVGFGCLTLFTVIAATSAATLHLLQVFRKISFCVFGFCDCHIFFSLRLLSICFFLGQG